MAHIITFALQKGGVGKTTSTVSVAEILGATGYKVLVVDFDSQGNATKMLTRNSIYKYSGRTVMEAIQEGNAEPYIVTVKNNLDLLPAEDRLAAFSRYIYTARINNPYATLKRLLEPLGRKYDYIFIDVGPTLGDTVINAIVCADEIIVPFDCGDLSMDALIRFMEFVDASREEGHTQAVIGGILLTMRDGRSRYEREVSEGIREVYGDLVFKTEIHRRVRIKEISAGGVDLTEPAMQDYISVVEEIIERSNKEEHHE